MVVRVLSDKYRKTEMKHGQKGKDNDIMTVRPTTSRLSLIKY